MGENHKFFIGVLMVLQFLYQAALKCILIAVFRNLIMCSLSPDCLITTQSHTTTPYFASSFACHLKSNKVRMNGFVLVINVELSTNATCVSNAKQLFDSNLIGNKGVK